MAKKYMGYDSMVHINRTNKRFNDQLDIQIAELQRKYEKAVELEKKIKKCKLK